MNIFEEGGIFSIHRIDSNKFKQTNVNIWRWLLFGVYNVYTMLADKGNATVVMVMVEFITKIKNILRDKRYKQIKRDPNLPRKNHQRENKE